MKIRPVGADFFHAGGQTDMTKLLVAFHNCVSALKSSYLTETSNLSDWHEERCSK